MKPKDVPVEREILALSKELYECKPPLSESQFKLHLRELLDIYDLNSMVEVKQKIKLLAYKWDGKADGQLVDEINKLAETL